MNSSLSSQACIRKRVKLRTRNFRANFHIRDSIFEITGYFDKIANPHFQVPTHSSPTGPTKANRRLISAKTCTTKDVVPSVIQKDSILLVPEDKPILAHTKPNQTISILSPKGNRPSSTNSLPHRFVEDQGEMRKNRSKRSDSQQRKSSTLRGPEKSAKHGWSSIRHFWVALLVRFQIGDIARS